MKILDRIKNLLSNQSSAPQSPKQEDASGFMAFSHTGQVVAARKALLEAGLNPQIKAPPPSLREGCDMVLEFPAELEAVYLAVLEEKKIRPLQVMAIDGPLTTPESLLKRSYFPEHYMVAAANMKITVESGSGRVVNISGGGCPDVPYLASLLSGKIVTEIEKPDELSRSLCSFSLAQATVEAARIFKSGARPNSLPQDSADHFSHPSLLPWPKNRPKPLNKPWLIVGTVSDPESPLGEGVFSWENKAVNWNGQQLSPERGTAALMAAYAICAEFLGLPPGRAVLAGDNGGGEGSRAVYSWLLDNISNNPWSGLTFHYLFPEASSHDRIFLGLDELEPRPLLVADAGFMYVAKLCGQAPEYDLFTPDAGEMAYLADEKAPHPFYTRGALIHTEIDEKYIAETHRHGNAAQSMLVKGKTDRVVWRGNTVYRVDRPQVPAMEAIGGTGDTATGMASAFLAAGYSPPRASALAAHLNRLMGLSALPTPGSGISELISCLPALLHHELGRADGG